MDQMSELLTTGQMQQIEQREIALGRVSGRALMERAGQGIARAITAHWPDAFGPTVVLCGPGNNGGDGYVVARLLAEQGWKAHVFAMGDTATLPEDARANYQRWQAIGNVQQLDLAAVREALCPDALVIDALFGAGLTRPIDGAAGEVLAFLAGRDDDPPRIKGCVAVDGPSGLCLDSGRSLQGPKGVAPADVTVTFERRKLGHVLAEGAGLCGRTVTAPIGLDRVVSRHVDLDGVATLVRPPKCGMPECMLRPDGVVDLGKSASGHKFRHGSVLVLSGPSGKGGAARLAARGALRLGAGLVTVVAPSEAMAEHAAHLDAVMLAASDDANSLQQLLNDRRVSAVCLGPGLGLDDRAKDIVGTVLGAGLPAILDADALTLIARNGDLRAAVHDACVLTPHNGEFARLCPALHERLIAPATQGPAFSKADAARAAAADLGASVVLKGADTVIADKDGLCRVNPAVGAQAVPWLATAGSGDVLAGFIAGLLARVHSPMDAACTGVWMHAEAGRVFGPGLIAEDLPDMVPRVLRSLCDT